MPESLLRLRITDVIEETTEAASFILESVTGNPVSYKAGQFLTFIFFIHSREVRRSYSISSTPGIDDFLQVTVKRIDNGEISRLLLNHYKKGDELTALPPSGMFVNEKPAEQSRDLFFIAAGSGITPVLSLLREALFTEPKTNVILIYQNHSGDSIIFYNVLTRIAREFADRFNWINFITQSGVHNNQHKKLTNDQLEVLVRTLMKHNRNDARFFVCGPPSFMRMCQYTIRLMGFKEEQIRKEYFVIDTPPPPPFIQHPRHHTVSVTTSAQSFRFATRYPETILQSALKHGIELPYSCKGGRCSTCVAICKKGKIIMSMNDVLTESDLQSGLVLTCVGYADTDIELEFP